jgi:hypothetical protein
MAVPDPGDGAGQPDTGLLLGRLADAGAAAAAGLGHVQAPVAQVKAARVVEVVGDHGDAATVVVAGGGRPGGPLQLRHAGNRRPRQVAAIRASGQRPEVERG